MKWLFVIVAMLVAGAQGFGFRRQASNDCGTDAEACTGNRVCSTTPFGNKCFPANRFSCTDDSDCDNGGACFKANGADAGMCDGCDSDSDCPTGESCSKKDGFLYGVCAECSEDSQCATGEYCDAPQFSFQRGRRSRHQSGRFGGGRRGNFTPPSFTCMAQKAAGESCKRNEECVNDCQRNSRGRRSRTGTCT